MRMVIGIGTAVVLTLGGSVAWAEYETQLLNPRSGKAVGCGAELIVGPTGYEIPRLLCQEDWHTGRIIVVDHPSGDRQIRAWNGIDARADHAGPYCQFGDRVIFRVSDGHRYNGKLDGTVYLWCSPE